MPMTPPVTAARPMRAPTTMPAPKVEVESSIAPRTPIFAAAMPPTSPVATPPPRSDTDRFSSTGSVSARRMLATASPEGKTSFMRSTRIGV